MPLLGLLPRWIDSMSWTHILLANSSNHLKVQNNEYHWDSDKLHPIYLSFPWNLCKILSSFCKPISQNTVDDQRFVKSKSWAKHLVEEYDSGLHRRSGEFGRFLDASEPLGRSLRSWAMSDSTKMGPELLCELVAYSASLTSMQRLESKHHLVSQRMSIARNSTPSTLSANLRRTLNGDVNSEDFKTNFGRYLMEFSELVDTPWQSRTELARLISGYHLDVMFADLSQNQELILSPYVPKHTSKQTLDLLNHLKTVLEEGAYYAMPLEIAPDGTTTYSIVQLVTFTPSSKKYMQKVLKWSEDPWFEKIGVVMVGNTYVQPTEGVIDCDVSTHPCPLPNDFSFTTRSPYPVELSVDSFFQDRLWVCILIAKCRLSNRVLNTCIALSGSWWCQHHQCEFDVLCRFIRNMFWIYSF